MKRLWYLLKLIFYPLRLVLYWFSSFMIFLTKPGAKMIVAGLLVGTGLLLRTFIDPIIGGTITRMAETFRPGFIYDYRIEIAFSLIFIVIYLAVGLLGSFIAPAVSALPAPKRPLRPLAPLSFKEHTIDTVSVSVALKKPSRGAFRGDPAVLVPLVPEAVQDVLNKTPEPEEPQAPELPAVPTFTPPPDPAPVPKPRPMPAQPRSRPAPPAPPPQPPAGARPPNPRSQPPSPSGQRPLYPEPPEFFRDD